MCRIYLYMTGDTVVARVSKTYQVEKVCTESVFSLYKVSLLQPFFFLSL